MRVRGRAFSRDLTIPHREYVLACFVFATRRGRGFNTLSLFSYTH